MRKLVFCAALLTPLLLATTPSSALVSAANSQAITDIASSYSSLIEVKGGRGRGGGWGRGGRGKHYGWSRGRGHHKGWSGVVIEAGSELDTA